MSALGQSEARPITLGRYELIAPIGRGGTAEVHLAAQRGSAGLEKLVVIKLVHEHLAAQPAFAQMLADEARHAGLIKHPNVVEIHELGAEAGRHFIVMEYLAGEPLLEVLRIAGGGGARLDSLSIARVIADTAEGLDAAHQLEARDGGRLELVHHDVSPGNIVVLYSGHVKLVDFGVAKAQQAPGGPRVHGKLGYMSPEKVQNAAVDRRSDIWSLGCVLWEALTLRRLFKGDTDADTVRQVLGAPIAPPSRSVLSAPPELDAIVLRALERDPKRRYQTAKAMAADLEAVLRDARYGAKNDRIAQYMEAVFAPRIAARERVLLDVSQQRRPSPEILDVAFGEVMTHAARTIPATSRRPATPTTPAVATEEESAHEVTTMKTSPNAPDWRPAPGATTGAEAAHALATDKMPALARELVAAPPADAPPGTEPAVDFEEPWTQTALTPMTPAHAAAAPGSPTPRGERALSPGAFSQPRTRQTGKTEPPKVFSVASLLDMPEDADEPIRPDEPLLPRSPNAPAAPRAPRAPGPQVTPSAPIPAAARVAPPAPPAPPAPIPAAARAAPPTPPAPIPAAARATPPTPIPALSRATPPAPPAAPRATPPAPSPTAAPPRRGEPNPFADDDDLKTVADVIPANAEASRSLQSEPSWTVARQSAALGELQRWVQETRSPPKSRWDALVRKVRPWHQRVVAWSFKRRVPPWSPYAAASVVLLLLLLLVARCTGGSSDARPNKPAAGAAPASGEIEMDAGEARPPKQR